MTLVLDSTPGGTTSNSYVIRSDVDLVAPFTPGIGAAWLAAASTPDVQSQALFMATQRIDQLRFVGVPTYDDQALEWPRTGVTDRNGRDVDEDTLPLALTNATMRLAMYYVPTAAVNVNPLITATQSIKSAQAGDARIEYFASAALADPGAWNDTADLPADVLRLLSQFLALDPTDLAEISGWGSARAIRAS